MKRSMLIALFTLMCVPSLLAQAPAGWKLRADRSTSASDPDAPGAIRFVAMGAGFHATNPQAAVYWNPANTATGAYTLTGSFKLIKPSSHTNYYGLVFGGSGLEGATQNYLYFMVAQNGTWMVKRREGDASTQSVAQGPNSAVKTPGADGTSTNVLSVRVAADKVDYLVNGTTVHSTPRTGLTAQTDGLYGIRVNHQLEVHVDGFALSK